MDDADNGERFAVVAIGGDDGKVETVKAAQGATPEVPISDAEYAAWEEDQQRRGAVAADGQSSISADATTEAALRFAATRPASELVPLMIALRDPAFDFRRLARAKLSSTPEEARTLRAAIIAERQQQVSDAGQSEVQKRLLNLKANVISLYWIDNSIRADVPAGSLTNIADWSEVVQLQYVESAVDDQPSASGANIQDDTLGVNLAYAGYDGSHGSQNSPYWPNVTIAIMETRANGTVGFLRKGHPAFWMSPTDSATRVASQYDCAPNCAWLDPVGTANSDETASHGTVSAWLASGSVIGDSTYVCQSATA